MLGADRLAVDVRIVSAEPGNFFDQTVRRVGHELPVALVPQFVAVRKPPGDPTTAGLNDTCPPTSMYSAYNIITAPKRLMLAYDTGHRSTQEQVDDVNDWLADELTGRPHRQ